MSFLMQALARQRAIMMTNNYEAGLMGVADKAQQSLNFTGARNANLMAASALDTSLSLQKEQLETNLKFARANQEALSDKKLDYNA